MDLHAIYTPHRISDADEIEVKDAFFTSFERGGSHKEAIETIHTFFAEKNYNYSVVHEFSQTYFQWFVRIVWENPWAVSLDIWPSIVAHTYPTAIVLGFDCLPIYLQYAIEYVDKPALINRAHTEVKRICAEKKEFPIDVFSQKATIVYDHIDRFVQDEEKADSLGKAEFLSLLEQEIRKAYTSVFIIADDVDFSEKVQSVLFFWRVVAQVAELDDLAARFFWDQMYALDTESKLSVPELSEAMKACIGVNLLLKDSGQPEIPIEVLTKVLEPKIKNILEDLDTKAEAKIDNVVLQLHDKETSEIISLLQTLATEKGNPRIADVYFFNEQTGAFAWDEALLRELKLIPEDFDMSAVDVDKKDTSE